MGQMKTIKNEYGNIRQVLVIEIVNLPGYYEYTAKSV